MRRRMRRWGSTRSSSADGVHRAAGDNRRTWTYRIRPSVTHKPFTETGTADSQRPFNEVPTPPNQMRWNPMPMPEKKTDFVEGMVTMGGNGDPAMQTGVGIHFYTANVHAGALFLQRRWRDADGAAAGTLRVHTELGILGLAPGEIGGDSARHQVSRGSAGWRGPRLHLRELRAALPSAGAGADRRQWAGQSARFPDARGGL